MRAFSMCSFSRALLTLCCLLLVVAIPAIGAPHGSGEKEPGRRQSELALEDFLSIRFPSQPAWSPDGQRIAFLWEDSGVAELWWAAAGGGSPQRLAGADNEAGVSGFDWSSDSRRIAFARGGDIFLGSLTGEPAERVTASELVDSEPAFSPDGGTIAFVRAGQIWVLDLTAEVERQLTDWLGTAGAPLWDERGERVAALVSERRRVEEPVRELFGRRMAFFAPATSAADLACVELAGGEVVWLERGAEHSSQPAWSSTGKIAWQQVSADAQRRRILVAGAPDWHPAVVVDETDEAWWSLTYLEAGPRWEPGAERIAFLSDRSGWTHLYVIGVSDPAGAIAAPGSAPVQVTRGEFEVEAPRWHPDGKRIVLAANRGAVSERSLFLVDIPENLAAPREVVLQPISRLRGTSTSPEWSPDASALLFLHADTRRPLDIWVQRPEDDEARQVSRSSPGEGFEEQLLVPEVVRFPSGDGRLIVAQLTLPRDVEPDDLVPAVVWVHGGGVRQNRYGWHPRRAYAIFYGLNQYLAQQGYMVLAVDYRGSIGYGRDFRVAPHLDLGGGDLDDLLAAARYLKDLDEPRAGKVGIWGISYGGYLTVQALVQAPSAFDAGIDVAGVVDWQEWAGDPGGLWIQGRTADQAVPVLQSFRLVDALIRAGKGFDIGIYPGETHAFTYRRTWMDAMTRVERFFSETLR